MPFLTGIASRWGRGGRAIGDDVTQNGGTGNVDLVGKLAINKIKGPRSRFLT